MSRRHRRNDQAVMRRGPMFGWKLVRQDGTAVYSTPKKDTRISRRLMRELLQDSDLHVSYHRVLTNSAGNRVDVFTPNPNQEPGEWSPFTDDGHFDIERLKEEGWLETGLYREDQ